MLRYSYRFVRWLMKLTSRWSKKNPIQPPAGIRQKTARKTIGDLGENLAADELQRRGYRIIARNYTINGRRGGEIDIIAQDKNELVFVEVKTRTNKKFGNPEEAVGRKKIARMSRAAVAFCVERQIRDTICRCDIVAITMLPGRPPEILILENATPLHIHL